MGGGRELCLALFVIGDLCVVQEYLSILIGLLIRDMYTEGNVGSGYTMITAAATLPALGFRLPAIESFSTSLSFLILAGFDDELDSQITSALRSLEGEFVSSVRVEKFLRARGNKAIEEAFAQSYGVALGYYVESSAIIWRGLNHDYDKLLRLSRTSSERLERVFFDHANKLKPQTFIAVVTSLRVLAKVAEWVIIAEKDKSPSGPPMDYLSKIALVTFLTWCLVAYITGQTTRARKDNIDGITDAVKDFTEEILGQALKERLPWLVGEMQEWYWNFEWQEGEVEADLDKHQDRVETFKSADALIQNLNEQ